MNKAELVESLAKEMQTSKAQAERSLNSVLSCVTTGLRKEKNVQLVGFGTFNVKNRKPRKGVNPRTGEPIKIKAGKTVGFKAGKGLKSVL